MRTHYYASRLLEGQGKGGVNAIAGAASSHKSFHVLAQAVLEQAQKEDSSIAFINTAY